MADQIGVQIVAADQQFIAATKATSAAMAAVVAQEEKLGKAAKSAGLEQKKFSATYKQLEKQRAAQESKAAKDSAADQTKKQRALTLQKAKETKAQKDATALRAKEQKELAKSDKEALATAKAMGKEFVGIGLAVAAAAVALGVFAVKAKEAKDNTRGVLDVLTAGRGEKALGLVDGLAVKLGVDIGATREQFIKFRQAGLDNKQSARLLKLAADLNTVDKSGGLAAEAVERVLAHTSNNTQTSLQAEASTRTMALLAKQAKVAGDGTKAAAANAVTLTGAIARLGNTKTQALEKLGDKIQPSIDKAASSVADFVEKLAASKEGQKTLEDTALAIGRVAEAITSLATADPDSAIAAIRDGFTIAKESGAEVILIFKDVGLAFKEVASAAFEIPYAFYKTAVDMYAIGGYIFKSVANLPDNIKHFVVDPIANAGPDIINGLIDGLSAGAGRLVKAVVGLAGKVKDGFKDALRIGSPSKVFAGYGLNIGQGLNIGLNRSMPQGQEMAQRMLPAPEHMARAQSVFAAPAPIFAPAPAAQSSSSERPTITINIHDRATEEDGRRLEKVIDLWWSRKMQQQGLQ